MQPLHEQTFYLLRHRVTGNCMPLFDRGGYTHWDPEQPTAIPRLFTRKQDANCSATHWSRGAVTVRSKQDYWGEWDEEWSLEEIPGRNKDDLEVIEITLTQRIF